MSAFCVTPHDSHSQLSTRLPHIVQVKNIRMIDQLHDHNFPLNAQEHLVRSRTGLGHGHARVEDEPLGHDLDRGVLSRD